MAYDIEKDIEHLGKRHKKAAKKLKPKSKRKVAKKKENWVERLKRKTQMLLKGKHYKAPKKK
jgi:hypothetical protein